MVNLKKTEINEETDMDAVGFFYIILLVTCSNQVK